MSAARVFDSDVANDEDVMRALAMDIILSYHGNWDAMIGWQQHCRVGNELGVKDVRAILNATLSDATQAVWWSRIRAHLNRPPMLKPQLRVVRDDEQRVYIRLGARWNSSWFRPNHYAGKIHLIDNDRTRMEWKHPYDWDFAGGVRYDIPKQPHLIVYGWCGKRYDNPLMPDHPQSDDEVCSSCKKVRNDPGTPPSARRRIR